MRSGGAGREWREESAPVDERQGRRCRVLSLRRRDPGEWSGLDDESPEAAVSEGAKPSPTATTDPRQNGAGAPQRRVQPLAARDAALDLLGAMTARVMSVSAGGFQGMAPYV